MSDPFVGWGPQLSPEQLAQRIKAQPFASVREQVMARIVQIELSAALPRTPLLTGLLRTSESTYVEPGGLRGRVESDVFYAPFAHARVPFFQMAIDATRAEVAKVLEEAGQDYLESIVR